VRAFGNLEDCGPCRESLAQPDIIGQKKAWIAFVVGAEDLLNRRKLVGFKCYRFLRWNAWERCAVQFPLDLLFPTELLGFEPLKFEG